MRPRAQKLPELRRNSRYLKLRWFRLNQGKVRHLCWLTSYTLPPGDLVECGQALCGRYGSINMNPYRIPAGPFAGTMSLPARYPECKECLALLGEALPERFRRKIDGA